MGTSLGPIRYLLLALRTLDQHGVGSCPSPWCRSCVPEQRRLRVQAAMTGRLMDAVSLIVPSVSRLM